MAIFRRALPLLDIVGRDVRYALRGMRRTPSFTAVATVTGLVRNSHTAAIAMITTISAMTPIRLKPTRW